MPASPLSALQASQPSAWEANSPVPLSCASGFGRPRPRADGDAAEARVIPGRLTVTAAGAMT
jgi:hypothetical protein